MAFNRIFGILIAIGIFIASIIFFAILPTLEFRKQKEALTLIAQVYEQTWRQHENDQPIHAVRPIDRQPKQRVRSTGGRFAELQPETDVERKVVDGFGKGQRPGFLRTFERLRKRLHLGDQPVQCEQLRKDADTDQRVENDDLRHTESRGQVDPVQRKTQQEVIVRCLRKRRKRTKNSRSSP